MRLAYADPPYPGKAHLYPENTEVDHVALVGRLGEYDGWALSTDETNLRYVLGLCPPTTRVLAWCRTSAPPFGRNPIAAWEPVLCKPARITAVPSVRSYLESAGPIGFAHTHQIVGQKTEAFCRWIIGCLGASQSDTLADLYPGTGVMGRTFETFTRQQIIPMLLPPRNTHGLAAERNKLRRAAVPLDGMSGSERASERRV